MVEAVIAAVARSPIGRARKGSLAGMRGDDMLLQMAQAALAQVPELQPHTLDDVVVGCGQPAGEQGHNQGRQLAIALGLDTVPGTVVNRYCASSVQTTRMAFHAIKAGEGHAFLSGGVEAVSRYEHGVADNLPGTHNERYADAEARSARRAKGGAETWTNPREAGELPDPYIAMGQTAENVAQSLGIGREEQDAFGVRSQNLAEKAIADGFYEREISPLTLPDGSVVSRDDGPRAGVTLEAVSALQPVFRPDGTITAGNCCPLNDGAAALVVLSDTRAKELGIRPLARIVSTGVTGLSPEIMGLGPIGAVRAALRNAGMQVSDLDLIELNEAFAVQVIGSIRELGADMDRVNVHGGAIALGHPFGMTGARMTATLLNGLRERDKQFGVVTMCAAQGQGMALILERLN